MDAGDGAEVDDVRPLSRVRRIIAERMQASLQGSAQLTSVVEADLTSVMALRRDVGERFRLRHGVGLTPLAVLARGACVALADHPQLNARLDADMATATYFRHVNLGFAVDTEAGLVVPNVRRAQVLGIPGLARGIADVANRARRRKLTLDDLVDGTFTITNTGSRGSLLDTPILNAPEVGILALGKVERRPVVVVDSGEEKVAIRDMSYLCLTYDHRLVDGADAARFLTDLKAWVETTDLVPELDLGDA